MNIDLYSIAHTLKNKLPFVWDAIEKVNEWLFLLRYGSKVNKVCVSCVPDGFNLEKMCEIPTEKIMIIARQSKMLLESWYKIPGMREDGSIDGVRLKNWIVEARRLAEESDRLEVADMEIGSLLSRFPEGDEKLSPEEIFRVIEEINSENLNNNYSIGLSGKLRSIIREPSDGGTIERERADYFGKLADKYRNKYPIVSGIFSDLEQDYLARAKQMDDQAQLEGLEF